MDPLEEKLQALIAEWEGADPGSTDIEQPPREPDELPDLPPPGEMRLPEMDFSGGGGGGDAPAPPAEAPAPAPPHAAPTRVDPKTLDWKGLGDGLRNAELRQMQSKAGDRLRANAGESGAYRTLPRGDEQIDLARQPLALAKEKQGMESRDLSMQTQRNALGVKDAMDNPNSLQSQKAREAWKAFGLPMPPGFDGWSANEVQRNIGGAQSARAAQTTATTAAAKTEKDAGETEALRREVAKIDPGADLSGLAAVDLRAIRSARDAKERARIIAAAAAKKAEEGRPLAPTALEDLADADVAKKQVAGLARTFDELGMGSPSAKVSSFFTNLLGLQFTDAAKFEAEAQRVRQAAGKILEGGKLAAGDETKYRAMLLKPGDGPEVVAAKTAGMLEFLEDVKAGRIKVYRAGGYKVPESIETPKEPATGGKIRVRRKSDGLAGTLLPEDFNEETYEKI